MAEDIHWQQFAKRYKVYDKLISTDTLIQPDMIVCIPSYAEPHLISTLESLVACDLPGSTIEVIILFNEDDRMSVEEQQIHALSYRHCLQWISSQQATKLKFHCIWLEKWPVPKWGVGWARKLLMDEAARRMGQHGVIVNLDADCTVAGNYLQAIDDHFKSTDCDAISIYVEHNYEKEQHERKQWIIDYELHLRYLVHAKRWAGHPFAYQTFGSAMAVRRNAYLLQGGMNTRQAGEDFYFLQKFIETGKSEEMNSTTVFPSCRTSLRVPFGTGKAMHDMEASEQVWKTTSFETFELIRPLLTQIEKVYSTLKKEGEELTYSKLQVELRLSDNILSYLESIELIKTCNEILRATSSYGNFEKRFFRKFNAFAFIRYMHEMRAYGYADVEVLSPVRKLLEMLGLLNDDSASNEDCLLIFRKIDRGEILF